MIGKTATRRLITQRSQVRILFPPLKKGALTRSNGRQRELAARSFWNIVNELRSVLVDSYAIDNGDGPCDRWVGCSVVAASEDAFSARRASARP